jgi:hypothetical protein
MVKLKYGKIQRLEKLRTYSHKKKENVACCSAQKCSRYPRKFRRCSWEKFRKNGNGLFCLKPTLRVLYIGVLSKNAGGVERKRRGEGGAGGRRICYQKMREGQRKGKGEGGGGRTGGR